jgi:hypothetical protein
MFRVGQKVACIETWHLNGKGNGDERGPVKGSAYTIRQIGVGLSPKNPSGVHVRLVEIENPTRRYREGVYEVCFGAWRFRPIVERATDISVFTEILRRETLPSTPSPLPLVEVGK